MISVWDVLLPRLAPRISPSGPVFVWPVMQGWPVRVVQTHNSSGRNTPLTGVLTLIIPWSHDMIVLPRLSISLLASIPVSPSYTMLETTGTYIESYWNRHGLVNNFLSVKYLIDMSTGGRHETADIKIKVDGDSSSCQGCRLGWKTGMELNVI